MGYADIVNYNCSTKETTFIPVTDEWIRALGARILLSLSATSMLVSESVLLTAQLVTAPLLDGSQEPIAESRELTLLVGDFETSIILDASGAGSYQIEAALAGSYKVGALNFVSNELTLEVV